MNYYTTSNHNDSTIDDFYSAIAIFAPSLAPRDNDSNNSNNSYDIMKYVCFSGIFIVFGSAFIFFSIAWILQVYRNEHDRLDIITNSDDNDNNNGSLSIGRNIPLRLLSSLDDCIELYNKTFDLSGNQLTLKSKHIVDKVMKDTTNNVTEEEEEEEGNTIELFIDIESGGNNGGETEGDDDDDEDDDDDPVICLSVEVDRKLNLAVDDTTTTRSLCLTYNKANQMISGTCVICFEEYVTDDVIVWSDDSNCNHIYHKECMVHYFATNAQFQKIMLRTGDATLDVTDNPCPTCRRPDYCIVHCEDSL